MDDYNNQNSNENINNEQDNSEMLKQLNILDISYTFLFVILIAVIINIKHVEWNKIKVLDSINNTNILDQVEDFSESPKLTNKLYLISTIVFIFIIYDSYKTQILLTGDERDENKICDAWKNFVAVILVFTGTFINYTVLNRPK